MRTENRKAVKRRDWDQVNGETDRLPWPGNFVLGWNVMMLEPQTPIAWRHLIVKVVRNVDPCLISKWVLFTVLGKHSYIARHTCSRLKLLKFPSMQRDMRDLWMYLDHWILVGGLLPYWLATAGMWELLWKVLIKLSWNFAFSSFFKNLISLGIDHFVPMRSSFHLHRELTP